MEYDIEGERGLSRKGERERERETIGVEKGAVREGERKEEKREREKRARGQERREANRGIGQTK